MPEVSHREAPSTSTASSVTRTIPRTLVKASSHQVSTRGLSSLLDQLGRKPPITKLTSAKTTAEAAHHIWELSKSMTRLLNWKIKKEERNDFWSSKMKSEPRGTLKQNWRSSSKKLKEIWRRDWPWSILIASRKWRNENKIDDVC